MLGSTTSWKRRVACTGWRPTVAVSSESTDRVIPISRTARERQSSGDVEAANGSRFASFSVGDEPQTNRVNVLYEDRGGRLWAGTDGGLFFLEDSANPTAFATRQAGCSLAAGSCTYRSGQSLRIARAVCGLARRGDWCGAYVTGA